MRFISKYGRFGVQIVPMVEEAYATGMAKTIQEPVYAYFEPGKLLPHERELALGHWTWNGFYQEQDEVTTVLPDYRIGLFDSREAQVNNSWSDEKRELVETVLSDLVERYNDMIVVPLTMLAPPWPRYDEYSGAPSALVRKLSDEGYELEQVLEYERAVQNRPEIVTALEGALAKQPEEEVVVG